ncbi:MAG: YedE-related selenium metabolism membrane protein [Planctomycetes bacterium]|nr:YedE-related selenium metabolism membrane protein [Planctomycetota bacterium]
MAGRRPSFFASRWGIVAAGAGIGLIAAFLQQAGNPPNMGICVACFERDIAGALGLHRAAVVQYIRPEIIGFVLGSLAAALAFREFRARAGSAPIVRFVLGMFAMIGALAFLGCPWRALLRLAGGDLNAILGIAGLAAGIAAGVFFLKAGYSLGRSARTYPAVGWILPIIAVGLLLLRIFAPRFAEGGPIFSSASGPGSLHAPLLLSLGAGLAIGFVAQRTRFCTMGSVRDIILMRDTHLASGVAALLAAAFLANLALGKVAFGFAPQPVAHSDALWNVLGMALAGLAFALAGGCPGRQLFLAGEGDGDAAIFVIGMVAGAATAHNFALAGIPDKVAGGAVQVGGLTAAGQAAVLIGLVFTLAIGFAMREKG